jgi:hypothetical protein
MSYFVPKAINGLTDESQSLAVQVFYDLLNGINTTYDTQILTSASEANKEVAITHINKLSFDQCLAIANSIRCSFGKQEIEQSQSTDVMDIVGFVQCFQDSINTALCETDEQNWTLLQSFFLTNLGTSGGAHTTVIGSQSISFQNIQFILNSIVGRVAIYFRKKYHAYEENIKYNQKRHAYIRRSSTTPDPSSSNSPIGTRLKQTFSFSSSSSSSSSHSQHQQPSSSSSLPPIPLAVNASREQMLAAPSHNPFQTPLQIRHYGSGSSSNIGSIENPIAAAAANTNIVIPASNAQYINAKNQPPRSLRSSSAPLPLYAEQQVANEDDRAVYERLASEKHHGGMYTAREMVLPPDTSFMRKRVAALSEIPGSVARQEIVPGHKFGLPTSFKTGTDESVFYREQPKYKNQQLGILAAKFQLKSLEEKQNAREYMPSTATSIPPHYTPNAGRFAYTTTRQSHDNNVLRQQQVTQA